MSENKADEMLNILPNACSNMGLKDEKFLFFFDPKIMDEKKFLFGLSLKTGVQIFSAILLIRSITLFFDIFSPTSFLMFFTNIIGFLIYITAAIYSFLSTIKNKYSFAKLSYLIVSCLFLLFSIIYICKSIIKIFGFITPWDGDFLHLNFLEYIFGYGALLLIILYLIYILYHYMLELKNPVIQTFEEDIPYNEPMKSE